ncbi:hypothetical protein LUX09_05395 [Streptomyces albogriseolus]|nr:hypothetical protein [Streptomyces albogriseolus]
MTEQAARTDAAPERVVVPGVGLDARVEGVGVTERGDMTVPDDPAVAGLVPVRSRSRQRRGVGRAGGAPRQRDG